MNTKQHVVITGASSGIGLALALQYVANDYNVTVCGRDLNKLTQAIDNPNIYCVQTDISDAIQANAFIEKAIQKFGSIHILINNAGISMRASFVHLDLKVLHELMNINFWGTVNCTHAAIKSILSTKGTVCNISSIAGYRGLPWRSGYSASKFAMQGFSESLRTELYDTGVHVMWVSPGFTSSNIRNVALNASGTSQAETPLDESKLMSSATCAAIIINAISKRKRALVMTTQGKITVLLNKLWPSLADKLTYNHFKKEGLPNN
jgi:short-subunit dehydrogenase